MGTGQPPWGDFLFLRKRMEESSPAAPQDQSYRKYDDENENYLKEVKCMKYKSLVMVKYMHYICFFINRSNKNFEKSITT